MCDREPRRAVEILEDEARCPPDLRDFTWAYLRRQCVREEQVYADHQASANQPADPIHAVAYSPAGTLIATGGDLGRVRIWDPRDGRTWAVLLGHTGGVRGVAFTADGGAIATAGEDGTVRLWELPVEMLDDARKTVAFLPVIRPWVKALTLEPVVTIAAAHQGRVNCVAFSPDGRLLVSGGADGRLRWWNLGGWRTTNPDIGAAGGPASAAAALKLAQLSARPVWMMRDVAAHFQSAAGGIKMMPVECIAFAASGKVVVSGGADRVAKVWHPEGNEMFRSFGGHADAVIAIAVTPDGKTLATVNNNGTTPTVRLINVDTERDIRRLIGHTRAIYALAISADGELVASAGLDRAVRVWDLDGQARSYLPGHELAVTGVAFAPDRRTLVSIGMDATARVWLTTARKHDPGSIAPRDQFGHEISGRDVSLEAAGVSAGKLPSDVTTFVTTFVNNAAKKQASVQVFRADSTPTRGRVGPLMPVHIPLNTPFQGPVRAVTASPDGRMILASTNDSLYVWRIARFTTCAGVPLPAAQPLRMRMPKPVYAMVVDPTGQWLATLDLDGVRVWNLHYTSRDGGPDGPLHRNPGARADPPRS